MPMRRESPPTTLELTKKRFFTVVNSHVRFEVAFFSELLSAAVNRADKGLHSIMRPHVDLKPSSP